MFENYQSPWMDEELHIMRDAVKKFLSKEFLPYVGKWEKQGFIDRDAWLKAGEAGILCASIPEEYGGGGGNFKHEMVLVEELGYARISGFGNGVHSGIVAHYINSYGTEEQKLKWLPKMATGEIVSAIAMTEPGTGSDLQAVATTAINDGQNYVVNGQKTFLTNGGTANLICLVAKTDPAETSKGISLIMVETESVEGDGGFTRGANLEKLGMKAQDTAEIFFDDVKVPADNLLGTTETALRLTSEYVKERKAFGKRILDFQNTQFRLAERYTEAKLARVFVDDCAMKLAEGKLDNASAAMAKWWTTQKQCEIVDECLQFFGGYGFMMEYPIAKMYADSRIQKIYGGSNEIMKLLIAREI
jgi:acyl-CoA dehydrogenase